MKVVAGFSSLFGLAFHIRVYKIVAEPVVANMIESVNISQITIWRFMFILFTPWIPMMFYLACFIYCFVRVRTRLTVGIGVAILTISVPYFMALFHLSDTPKIACLVAGGSAIYNHLMIFPPRNNGEDQAYQA